MIIGIRRSSEPETEELKTNNAAHASRYANVGGVLKQLVRSRT
jgi:hypothetical protein